MELLGVRIDNYKTETLREAIREMLNTSHFHQIATVNPEFLVEAQHNPGFKELLNNTALNICDGAGIAFWFNILYKKSVHRLPGVEVAELACQVAQKEEKSVYLLGGFGVTGGAVNYLKEKFPDLIIAGHQDGDPRGLDEAILKAKPDVILVAFGAPTQEFWLENFGQRIPSLKLGIGIGGTFDFWSGKVKRAPAFIRKIGLEWVWRLCQEPRKRFRRIYTAVVMFSWLALREKFGGK